MLYIIIIIYWFWWCLWWCCFLVMPCLIFYQKKKKSTITFYPMSLLTSRKRIIITLHTTVIKLILNELQNNRNRIQSIIWCKHSIGKGYHFYFFWQKKILEKNLIIKIVKFPWLLLLGEKQNRKFSSPLFNNKKMIIMKIKIIYPWLVFENNNNNNNNNQPRTPKYLFWKKNEMTKN